MIFSSTHQHKSKALERKIKKNKMKLVIGYDLIWLKKVLGLPATLWVIRSKTISVRVISRRPIDSKISTREPKTVSVELSVVLTGRSLLPIVRKKANEYYCGRHEENNECNEIKRTADDSLKRAAGFYRRIWWWRICFCWHFLKPFLFFRFTRYIFLCVRTFQLLN